MRDERRARWPAHVPDPLRDLFAHSTGSWDTPANPVPDAERIARTLAAAERIPDAALLQRCGTGDETAWRLLVRRYQNLVWSTALDVGLSSDDAGDVFQEVWVELHRSVARIRHPEALPRWLIVATRRLSYKVATRRRRLVSGISRDLVDPSTLPDERLEAMRIRSRLENALDSLGGKCADLLRLLFFSTDRLPYEEISRRTGLAVGSIGPIRGRCLARLRSALEEEEGP